MQDTSAFPHGSSGADAPVGGGTTQSPSHPAGAPPLVEHVAPTAAGLGDADVFGHLPYPATCEELQLDDSTLELVDFDAELAQLVEEERDRQRRQEQTAVPVTHRPDTVPARHRKPKAYEHRAHAGAARLSPAALLDAVSAALAVLICVSVTALGALTCYDPLHQLAARVTEPSLAQLWPMLIYGPWAVATLAILRARMNHRSTLHSWLVVVFLALAAMVLCVTEAPHTPSGFIIAGLPPVTVLLCCHQLVRQLDLFAAPPAPARHAQTRGAHRHRAH